MNRLGPKQLRCSSWVMNVKKEHQESERGHPLPGMGYREIRDNFLGKRYVPREEDDGEDADDWGLQDPELPKYERKSLENVTAFDRQLKDATGAHAIHMRDIRKTIIDRSKSSMRAMIKKNQNKISRIDTEAKLVSMAEVHIQSVQSQLNEDEVNSALLSDSGL